MASKRETRRTAAVPAGSLDPVTAFALLVAELAGDEETPEPGYFTVLQWAEKVGKSQSQAATLLRRQGKRSVENIASARAKRYIQCRTIG